MKKLLKAVCVFGAAVLGGVIVNKIKSPGNKNEKKCTPFSGIKLVKDHWRKLVAVFLVGWGFGIWTGIKTFLNKNKMEVIV